MSSWIFVEREVEMINIFKTSEKLPLSGMGLLSDFENRMKFFLPYKIYWVFGEHYQSTLNRVILSLY